MFFLIVFYGASVQQGGISENSTKHATVVGAIWKRRGQGRGFSSGLVRGNAALSLVFIFHFGKSFGCIQTVKSAGKFFSRQH